MSWVISELLMSSPGILLTVSSEHSPYLDVSVHLAHCVQIGKAVERFPTDAGDLYLRQGARD